MIRHAVYCKCVKCILDNRLGTHLSRECFFLVSTGKFRRALETYVDDASPSSSAGTRRSSSNKDRNMLVAFSGGLGSTVLLDAIERVYFPVEQLARGGKAHPRRKMWNTVHVCYVEICGAFDGVSKRNIYLTRIIMPYGGT